MSAMSAAPAFLEPGDPDRISAVLSTTFTRLTGRAPAVVATAPGRVNLIGEHLDYNGGRCLPLALPHATYVAAAPREDRLLRMTSLQVHGTEQVELDGLEPGSVSGWSAYVAGVVWALEAEGWTLPGVDLVVDSRVPVGSGLSSSAALECAVALALLALAGPEDSPEVRRRLVDACVRAETGMAGAPTGGMDQSVALLAEDGHALLLDFTAGSAEQVPWQPAADGLELLVVDTHVSHTLTDGGYADRRADCEEAARRLAVPMLRAVAGHPEVLEQLPDGRLRRRTRHVLTEMARVDDAVAALRRGAHAEVGPLLDASHVSLREDFEVSCDELDVVVDTARRHGAVGARMTGGGFGGSAVALVPSGLVERVTAAVAAAFDERRWRSPGFLRAHAGRAGRVVHRTAQA